MAHLDGAETADMPLAIGARVRIDRLGVDAQVVGIRCGAVTRYQCQWWEPALNAEREAGFWREDLQIILTPEANFG